MFISSLILIATFCVAVLEQRLEARNKQLSKVNRELANRVVEDNLTKLPNRLFLAEYSHFLFTEHRYRDDKIAFLIAPAVPKGSSSSQYTMSTPHFLPSAKYSRITSFL